MLGKYVEFPAFAKQMVAGFVNDFDDQLVCGRDHTHGSAASAQVGNPPIWFQSLIWLELLFQLPFFFVAAYAFATRQAWIKVPSVVYGIGVAATTFPIIVHQLFSGPTGPALAAIYAPYMIIPALVAAKFASAKPWSTPARKTKRR